MRVLVDYEKMINLFDCEKDPFGAQGFCLIKKDIVQKIYFERMRCEHDFTKYKSSQIAFPMHYLCDYHNFSSKEIVGEIMPYFDKESITWSINETTRIDFLIEHYLEILHELEKYPEIDMMDLCSANILYSQQTGFSIIDTTCWRIDMKQDFIDGNKRDFDFGLASRLVDNVLEIGPMLVTDYHFSKNLMRYGKVGHDLLRVLEATLDDDYQILAILQLYRLIASSNGLEPIRTLGDAKNYTKKLKNC